MKLLNFKKLHGAEAIMTKETDLFIGPRREIILIKVEQNRKTSLFDHHIVCIEKNNSYRYLFKDQNKFDIVQPMEDGLWLLASRYSDIGNKENASVFDSASGEKLYSFHLGDAIAECLVDEDNKIWVIYGDDGIFGDSHISQNGIACLNSCGELLPNPFSDKMLNGEIPLIVDGCSLNIMEDNSILFGYYAESQIISHYHKHDSLKLFEIDNGYPLWITSEDRYIYWGNEDNRIFSLDKVTKNLEEVVTSFEGNEVTLYKKIFARGSVIWALSERELFICDLIN
ncbi:hypothetical protein IC620_01515 [Hazenella sp. IB182357]|uniref:Uncharacterized protein n=1 Tax=Polycladospora coralii TaxID=2771432 RepID=A0A926RT02_9BACL|nr:hypothetical protein [Polycladospora coralii]MBD1371038.1 hypothetical protein [Polycladospora coralii]